MNALIQLITACLDYHENNAVNMEEYLILPANFEALWRLYFDPLLIETVVANRDPRDKTNAPGQTAYLSRHPITVRWTDGREDVCSDGRVGVRERVDNLVHRALSVCDDKDQLMSLLTSIRTSLFKADHVFVAWQRLYHYVRMLTYFDGDISEYLFERLFEVDMNGYENQLYEFIVDHLFEIWPTLTNDDLTESMRCRIVQLVQILMEHKTSNANRLIEQLTERICANTPAQNIRGHLCFFLLLSDLLPNYYKAGVTGAIKRIDQNKLIWYVDSIMNENNEINDNHHSALMCILKYMCMFTEYNLLPQWFDRLISHPNNSIGFEILEHSLFPTTTLATYVQYADESQVQQIIQCIKFELAKQHIAPFVMILESLAKNNQTQKYLFRSDDLYRILQSWLSETTLPSAIFHIVELLIDIGYSKCNKHAKDIAKFFLDEYSSTLIGTSFESRSPLAHIILFITSIKHNAETDTVNVDLIPEKLIQILFQSIDKVTDDDCINNIDSSSIHLISLSEEIVKPGSCTVLVQVLSSFIPDIMGLLGREGVLKKVGIILLAELLDLSSNERSVLMDSVQTNSTTDSTSEFFNSSQRQQLVFFSAEQTKTSDDIVRVQHEDFLKGEQFLKSLNRSESNKIDEILRSRLYHTSSAAVLDNNQDQRDRLVLTNAARENVSKVLEVLHDPIPILLEGSTGVGKSASVMEAARQSGHILIRYNMSSRLTIDDLLGKVALVLDDQTQTTRLQFCDGPFTVAFSSGHWILLDELNLAQDTVLQAIESALDTHQLVIHNTSSCQQSFVIHRMHPNFRLFATQNPNTGFFKGKREKLSPSFLSRFRPLIFKELPDNEWREIVKNRLLSWIPNQADVLAELLVSNFNATVKRSLNDPKQTLIESGPYAEISIRELLKWIDLLICWQKQKPSWSQDTATRAALLSFSAWCVYGARYRASGRQLIQNILTDNGQGGWGLPALQNIKMNVNHAEKYIYFDDIRHPIRFELDIEDPEKEWTSMFATANVEIIDFDLKLWNIAFQTHIKIRKALMTNDFIHLHGIYRIDRSWLWDWIISASKLNILGKTKDFALYGCKMYQRRFRHNQAQETIRTCFYEVFKDSDLRQKVKSDDFVRPEMPYVLTNRALSTIKQVCFNMNIKQPILITGAEGCGKSELLLTLAWFSGQRVNQLNITPETEPSALIGQLIPHDTKDENDPNNTNTLTWEHGYVTQAYINGQWVLLDNLGTAESSVLERLNPVLEQKPMLILTEKGDVDEQIMHENYQLVATMTPPNARQQSQINSTGSGRELSPALYNRFAVIHMQDLTFDITYDSEELLLISKALLSDKSDVDHKLVIDLCRTIFSLYTMNKNNFPRFTLRNVIRLLDSTHLLSLRFKATLDFISSLWTAYHVTIANQIKSVELRNEVNDHVKKLLEHGQPSKRLQQPKFMDWIDESTEHILSESRLNYANAVLGAVACNIPLLLEGPAAVGKTALISYLCKHMKASSLNNLSNSTSNQLERVNNTDTTTIQDYLGTFLPVNGGFAFQKGALYRAMENGWWFLADEFNLADPSVMNMLFPLLEGKNAITIPSSGKVIKAKAGFQFFATQNDASYANRHQLPVSLRNRFLEVQFGEFPKNELSEIIRRRDEIGKKKPPCLTNSSIDQLASFYHTVINTRSRITFRELVKWLHRHALFSPQKELWSIVGASLLGAKYSSDSTVRQTLLNDLQSIWPQIPLSPNPQIEIKETGGQIRFREGALYVDIPKMTLADSLVLTSPETFHRSLVRLALAVHAKEPVLLIGPTSCKTLLVETWARHSNRLNEFIKVHLTPDTEAGDLIGEIQPYSFLDLLKQLPIMAERVYLRFRSLCRHHNPKKELTVGDEIFIQPLLELIHKQLPETIRQFEEAYTRDEERRKQQDALHDNFTALRAEAEALLISPSSMQLLGHPKNELESTTTLQDFPSPSKPTSNITFTDFYEPDDSYDYAYQLDMQAAYSDSDGSFEMVADGFEDYDVALSLPESTTQETTTMSFNYVDDGFDQPIPVSTSDISSTTPAFEFDDGFDVLVHVKKPENLPESKEESVNVGVQAIILDDGFSSIINTATTVETIASSTKPQKSVHEAEFPESLIITIDTIHDHFRSMVQLANYTSFTANDMTLRDYQAKFIDAWERLTSPNFDRTKPIFLFNDGPVTLAAKQGSILFLEDLDLPSQAVIERLNSMLEPTPTFALTEDITSHTERGQLDITLTNQFQIFASVHQDQIHQVLKLSPATRSRFTEIYVPAYTEKDLRTIVKNEFVKKNVCLDQVDSLVELMFSIRRKVLDDPEWQLNNDIQLLFRWTDLITGHHASVSLEKRVFLGARFFYMDQLPLSRHDSLFEEWHKSLQTKNLYHEYDELFKAPTASHGAVTIESIQANETNEELKVPFEIGPGYIALRYTGVRHSDESINAQNQAIHLNELRKRFYCVPTPTLINQIARIFSATSSKTPLLLEGPPGIGKTQVVTQVCSLLNKQCERINLSANTSLDQLIGCIIPRFINGIRVFQWQEGRVLAAIKAKKWILFDELNLAAPEVLEGLIPLFYRGVTHFTVPKTGEIVDMKNILLFATMNPSTVGGGRSKLPRSISNLFTVVQLDDYSENELRIILLRLFAHDLKEQNINMDQLDALFDTHVSLKVLVRQGHVGRIGGPYELNLRDLSKFRDVFRGSIDSQLFHYKYMNTNVDENQDNKINEELNSTVGTSDARLLSIRKFAQVVYACQFQNQNDFGQACDLINSKFPINSALSKVEDDCSIDTSVAAVIRIGTIYIGTGTEEPSFIDTGLIHTKKTVRQLEFLAAACQSRRAILLEGDICSRKSSLVMELSRLTRNRLIIIPLHENFETTDLIGSWRPSSDHDCNNPIFNKIDTMFKQVIKTLFLTIMPLLSKASNEHVFTQFKAILTKRTPVPGATRYDIIPYEIESLQETRELLVALTKIPQMSNEIKVLLSCYARQADYYRNKLESVRLNGKQEMGFVFVESDFVQAIREGWWVLLDNINSAPAEVLERLNSLTEENPILSLYENSDGQVLTQSNGIHPNFRLFTTANLNRIYSNKLSSAFLNRVIRICLPPIDQWDVSKGNDPTNSDLYELISRQLSMVPAGQQLAHLLALMHLTVKQYVNDGRLTYPSDFLVTYRLLEQCIRTLRYLIDQNINPIDACYWSLLRSYCSSLKDLSEYQFYLEKLQQTINDLHLCSSSTIYSTPTDPCDQKQPLWLQQTQPIRSHFVQFEQFLTELILNFIQLLSNDDKLIKPTRELLTLFIDNILLPMTPADAKLIQVKQTLIDSNDNQLNLSNISLELIHNKKIKPLTDTQQSMSISTFIQTFLKSESSSFEALCHQLSKLLDHFISQTSFSDTSERLTFIQRTISIIGTFDRFFISPIFSLFGRETQLSSLCSHLIQYFRPLLSFKEKCSIFELLHDPLFIEAKQQFRTHIFKNFDTGLIWLFERTQTFPIRTSRKDLRKLVEFILKDQSEPDLLEPTQYFSTLLEWISFRWTFDEYLSPSIRQILQRNICITDDFIIECEIKFCCWELCKIISTMINQYAQGLPSESNTINENYLSVKKELETHQNELKEREEIVEKLKNRIEASFYENLSTNTANIPTTTPSNVLGNTRAPLQRNVSLYNPDDHDLQTKYEERTKELSQRQDNVDKLRSRLSNIEKSRRDTIDKALAARSKFNEEIETLRLSSAFQFVHDRLEKTDAKQINELCKPLLDAHRNSSLINSDGQLDVRAVLATPFGRQLIEHDNILESPLILFLCGFFTYPNFCGNHRLHITSDWKIFQNQLDIRILNSSDLFIYCPNKQSFSCCLLSIKNESRLITIEIFGLQQNIDTHDLYDILMDSLPDGIQWDIVQKQLPGVNAVLSDDDPQAFGFSCLLYLYEKTNISTNMTTNDIYDQVKIIYDQLKHFIKHNVFERKPLPIFIYQQMIRMQREWDIFMRENIDIDNDWLILIQRARTFIEPYQNSFAPIVVDNIYQELKYSIQSIELPDISSRLASLAYIQSLTTNYNCVHLIDEHLRLNANLQHTESIQDFQILFDFVKKSTRLLRLIIQHVIYGGNQFSNELYQSTPDAIAHLELVFRTTLKVIDIVDGFVHVDLKQSKEIFEEFQTKLDRDLSNLRFPAQLLSRYRLDNFITRLAPLFDEHRQNRSLTNTQIGGSHLGAFVNIDPREIREKTMQSKINEMIGNFTGLLSRASHLPLRPHHIIQRIHRELHEMKTFDIDQGSEINLQSFISKEQLLTDLLEKFTREVNQYTTFYVSLPNDRPIYELTQNTLSLDSPDITTTNHQSDLKKFREHIHNSSKAHSFKALNEIIRLTHAQVSNQTWLRALCLLTTNDKDLLRTILMLLNDDLALQFEHDTNHIDNDRTLLDNVALTYAQFRCDLLNEEANRDMLSNYISVACLSTQLREWTKVAHLNVFNLLENIKGISDDLNRAQNQMKNFPLDSSCSLLPVDLRSEDLICLLLPENTSIIQMICSKLNEIDLFLSCRIDKVEPMHLSATLSLLEATHGLSSFVYRQQASTISLFDKQRHIYLIFNETISIIQRLINLCIDPKSQSSRLIQICTSVKELFPLQIAIALTLMILIDWTANCLNDFKSNYNLLRITTLKDDEVELSNTKANIHQIEQELIELERLCAKHRREREDAELEYHFAMNEEHFIVGKIFKKVKECQERETCAEIEMQKKQSEVSNEKEKLQKAQNLYQCHLAQEQAQWMDKTLNYFSKISETIKNYIINIGKQLNTNISTSVDLNTFLNVPVAVAQRCLVETSASTIDEIQITLIKQIVFDTLNDLSTHMMSLYKTDPMYLFISFYCDTIRISFSSLLNSTSSWKQYSQSLQTSQMKYYAEQKKKESLCQLNLWTREQCSLFLNRLRMGYDQYDIMKNAQEISKYVRKEVIKFDVLVTSQENTQFQQLIREFERFVSYLLITGCRYFQLQRGIREPIDDLLITSDTTTDVYDFSRFPNTEVELLGLLERYENQLNSHSDILLFLPLHLTFKFNSNPFNIFDQIERSIQVLISFILPASFLIGRTWSTIDKLIENISHRITNNEYDIIKNICNEFSRLADEPSEIDDKGYFISNQLRSDLFQRLSYDVDDLCTTILKNRSNMKVYCDDLNQRWHLAMKEIFRGFIKTQKFHIHRQLLWNQRNVKLSHNSLLSTDTHSQLRLANIENILQQKSLVLQSIDSNRKLELLKKLQYIKLLYELTIGGIDNLESIMMSMPMEHMSYDILLELVNSTRNIYDRSEKLLLEVSLIDYVNNNQKITTNFELLENIYKQEFDIFNSFYAESKTRVETNLNRVWHSIDFKTVSEEAIRAKRAWTQAGTDFVKIRQEKRTKDEAFYKKALKQLSDWGHSIKSLFVSSSVDPVQNKLDQCFAYVLQDILFFMQLEQDGNREIFTVASQNELKKLIDLHRTYQSAMNLSPLNEQLFPKCENIFILEIDTTYFCLPQISVLFWNSDKNRVPCLNLPISLRKPTTFVYIVVKTKITHIAIFTKYFGGNKMKWSTLADKHKRYCLNSLKLACRPVHGQSYYTVEGVRTELNPLSNSLSGDLQNDLVELESQLINQSIKNKEQDELLSSSSTRAIDKVATNMNKIATLMSNIKLNPEDLSSATDVYNLFIRLPRIDKLKEVFDLLEIQEFRSISPVNQLVEDNDPAIHIDFQYVQTKSMRQAYCSSRQCLINAKTQMKNFINNLHLIRAYMTLTYAWANACSIDLSPNTQEEFGVMLKECAQLGQRSAVENNDEMIWQRTKCRRIINDSRKVCKMITRTSNNWTEIKRLTNISLSSIEEDFTTAFAYSEMSRDVHLWLIKIKNDDNTSTTLTCHPQKTILDFGFALINIHQRLTQRIYIHNHTDQDLDIRVDRQFTSDTLFDFIGESQQVNAGQMCELEVYLRPASTIGSFEENWNLLIDNNITLSNAIRPKIQIVEIDVVIPNDSMDFGLVPCSNHRIEKNIDLKNVLSCPVRVKSQIQATETNKRQSELILLNNELELPENSVESFGIALKPADNIDEDIDVDVCLAINSAKNLKWIKVLAQIRCTHLSIVYQGHTYMQNSQSDRVVINNFYKNEKRLIPIEFLNDGPIEYTLRLSSPKLPLTITEVNLPINTRKKVPIKIQVSDALQQEFVLIIDFVNMKRQCKLVFDCQTAQPKLTYSMEKSDNKQIITIVQSAHMQQIWNQDLQIVLPVKHEITFSNMGKAAATINYKRIVSSQDARTLVSANFRVEPDNLIVHSNSKVPVRLLYYPVNFEKFDVKVELETNTSVDPIRVPYYVEFHTPILQTSQRSLIDIELIQTGEICKQNVLTVKNIGKAELRLSISEPLRKKPFVKLAALQESTANIKPSPINQPLKIESKRQRLFNLVIDCDAFNTKSMPEMIELVEFELLSLCDPIINIDGKLVNRTVTIVIVGHTVSMPDFAVPQELEPSPWSDLELLPSSWLHQISKEQGMSNSYNALIAVTAIAHVCGLQQTKDTLPLTQNDWSTFCTNFNKDNYHIKKHSLTLDLFKDATTAIKATKTLIKLIQSSLKAYRSFFHQSSLFHRSFSDNESVRLQLFSVINTASHIDEAYAMQSYMSKLWNVYEQCTNNDGYRQSIELVHQCISNDCAMPEALRTFTKFIHQAIQPLETTLIVQQLSALIPSTTVLGELIKSSAELLDFKSILLFLHIDDNIKEVMIRLVRNEWQALLDLFFIFLNRQQSTNVIHQSLLLAAKHMDTLWNSLDHIIKSNLLRSIFVDYQEIIPILLHVSHRERAKLEDLLKVTEIILLDVDPSQSFTPIRDIFNKTYRYDISRPIRSFFEPNYSSCDNLVSQIYTFRVKLGHDQNPIIHTGSHETFCDIMHQIITSTANQWTLAKKAMSLAYKLLCSIGESDVTLSEVIAQILQLLYTLNPNENWNSVKKLYTDLGLARTWDNAYKFIEGLDCDPTILSLIEILRVTDNKQKLIETVFELVHLLLTEDELNVFKTHELNINKLSFNNSIIESFEKTQSYCPSDIREKINAYLILLRLASDLTSDIESQHILFDNIVPSWLTLFDIPCINTQQLFRIVSSILTSFPGLINTKGIPLAQQLYTTSLTSALCRLSSLRQRHREFGIIKPSNESTHNRTLILTTIHEIIAQRINNGPVLPSTTIQQSVPSPYSVVKPVLRKTTSVECPYSEEILKKMEEFIWRYINSLSQLSPNFRESDSVQHIVDVSLGTQKNVSQWYAAFTTFNVFVHYTLNPDNPERIKAGHAIVQYGLRLYRDLIIVQKILEPTFARIGVHFLMKELVQLEKSLLSLSLEKYPMMRDTLRQLNVDVSRIKVDFKPPSNSIAPKGRTPNKSKSDILPGLTTLPQPTRNTKALPSGTTVQDDAPMSYNDWASSIEINNDQHMKDALKLEKKRNEMNIKRKNKLSPGADLRTTVHKLASDILDQNTNPTKGMPAGNVSDVGETLSGDTGDTQEISIDLEMKAMQEHLQKQPNLIEMYEKINSKAASVVPDGKLDNRSALKPTSQHERWTYQLLVEIPEINQMIDLIVKEFRSHWEKFDFGDEHQIHWCIMIDNSGSMSVHRNAIYEALVIIMELLRKLETRFAVARFGTRTNQKILKKLDDLFTNQDGQYVLEALTFDEGTYPATGLARIAEKVFPAKELVQSSKSIIHRLVLMITDGLTQERDDQSYSEIINRNRINLGFMFIETADQSSSQVLLRGLKQAQSCVLKANNISELPYMIPQLMHEMLKTCLEKVSSSSSSSSSMISLSMIQIKVPSVDQDTPIEEILTTKQVDPVVNQTSYTISNPTASIPRLTQVSRY